MPASHQDDVPSTSAAFGVVTIAFTLIGWSSIPLFLRHFAEQIDAWTSNGWRYGFSALIWAPIVIVAVVRKRLPARLWKAAIVPAIVNAAGQVCFTYAHYRIEPGLLTFGLRSQLLFVAIGAWILFPIERLVIRRPGYLIGACVLMAGMVAVIALEPVGSDDAAAAHVVSDTGAAWGSFSAYVAGVALAILSGVLFAGYGLAVRKYMHGVNSVIAFAVICQYTAAALVALMLIFGEDAGMTALALPLDEFAMLLVSAVIGIAVGHVFYYMSIVRLGVAVSAGVLQLQPFVVAVGSYLLFGEVLSGGQWVGGFAAVAGALLMLGVQYRMTRRRRKPGATLAIAEGESGS